jgi:hypothetical protein
VATNPYRPRAITPASTQIQRPVFAHALPDQPCTTDFGHGGDDEQQQDLAMFVGSSLLATQAPGVSGQ